MSENGQLQPTVRQAWQRKVLNQELSLQEYAEKKLVLESRPSKAIVELTENCNFRCIMCSQAFDPKYERYDKDYNMPLPLFEKVAEEIFPDAYFVDLRGFGESVILPHWPEILDRLEKYPAVNWHLITNLSVPRDRIWERMMKCGFILGFSCDAATQETFEAIRVRSHFDRIVHNLELVTDCMRRYEMGFIYFVVTVQKRNVPELAQIMELAAKHGVPEVQFKIVRQFDGFTQHDEMVCDDQRPELARQIDRSCEIAIERGIRLTINDQELMQNVDRQKITRAAAVPMNAAGLAFPPRTELNPEFASKHPWAALDAQVIDTSRVSVHQQCFKPYHYTYIARDGRVGTCNHMMNPEILEMGNLNYQSFEEIWNGDDYQIFRESLVQANPMDFRCQWCFKHRLED